MDAHKTDKRWIVLLVGFVCLFIASSPKLSGDLNAWLAKLLTTKQVTPEPAPEPEPPTPKPIAREEALKLVQADDIKQYVTRLAASDLAGRGTGQPGNEKAAKYIMERLDQLGVPYIPQQFSTGKGTTTNIIGYISPEKPADDRLIVVGAHYDHLGGTESRYYPGADDNASGTAAVMEIAEALQAVRHLLKHTVLVQFYSAEELGLVGSGYYCNNPLFPKNQPDINKHAAMINLDMIGYLRSADNITAKEMERICGGLPPEDFNKDGLNMKDFVSALAGKYPFANRIAGYRPGGSDHAPFYRKSVPVVFLHTGSHPNYHKVTDTPEKLNYSGAEQVTRLAVEIALDADAALSR